MSLKTKSSTKSVKSTLSPKSTSLTDISPEVSDKKLKIKQLDIKITNPYVNTNLASKVLVKPNQLNNNIYISMKKNLKLSLENRCNKYGFIVNIHKIIEHGYGIMPPEDLSGSVIFDVKYSALIFLPTRNTNIICKITNVENNLLTAQNGPLLVMLKQEDINREIFYSDRGIIGLKNSEKKIQIDDYVIVYIRNIRFYTGDTMMIAMGRLENIPNEQEIEKYYVPPKIEEEELELSIKPEIMEAIDFVDRAEAKETNIMDI